MPHNSADTSGRRGIKRGSYCRNDDKLTLFRIIEKYKKIILSKRIDSLTNQRKNEAWQRITSEFNSVSFVPKTDEQLKNIYRNKVSEIKRLITKGDYDRLTSEYKPFLEFVDSEKSTEGDEDNSDEVRPEQEATIYGDDGKINEDVDNNSEGCDSNQNGMNNADILITEIHEGPEPLKQQYLYKNYHHFSQSSVDEGTQQEERREEFNNSKLHKRKKFQNQEYYHHRENSLSNSKLKDETNSRRHIQQVEMKVNLEKYHHNPKINEIRVKIMEEHLAQEQLKRKILEEKLKIQGLKRKKAEKYFQNYCKQTEHRK